MEAKVGAALSKAIAVLGVGYYGMRRNRHMLLHHRNGVEIDRTL